METRKIEPVYAAETKESGQEVEASEWNALAGAVSMAQETINSLIDDVAAIPSGGGDGGGGDGGDEETAETVVLTPQMFGAVGEPTEHDNIERDTQAFEALARAVNEDGGVKKAVYIPSGHYSIGRRVKFLKSCKVYGDGESTVIDCYDGSGGLAFGYTDTDRFYGSCKQLGCTISEDAHLGDMTLTVDDAEELHEGDFIIITDAADFSFHGSRYYYRTSEAVKVKSIDGNTVSLSSALRGNYYTEYGDGDVTSLSPAPPHRTVISRFSPQQYLLSKFKMVSHAHDHDSPETYYTLCLCGLVDSALRDVTVENHGNKVPCNIRLGVNFVVEHCAFRSYTNYIGDSYGLNITNSQRFKVSDCVFRAHSHALATGGDSTPWSIVNRFFVYERLDFETSESWHVKTMDLDVHSNAEYYKYKDIYAPHISCDTGGYNMTIEGCCFYHISTSFNCGGIEIRNCEIMDSYEDLLWTGNDRSGRASREIIMENCLCHRFVHFNMQDLPMNNAPFKTCVFRNNRCGGFLLRGGRCETVCIEGNVFDSRHAAVEASCGNLSVKDNVFINAGFKYKPIGTVNADGSIAGNIIKHDGVTDGAYALVVSHFDGTVANNHIAVAKVQKAVNVYGDANVKMYDNIFKIGDGEQVHTYLMDLRDASTVVFSRNRHNTDRAMIAQLNAEGEGMPVFIEDRSNFDGSVKDSGSTEERPAGGDVWVGFVYFDTTLGKPVYAKAIEGETVSWVDASGESV